jgi:hypothetical protein
MDEADLSKVPSKDVSDLEQNTTDAQTGPPSARTRSTLLGKAHRCGIFRPLIYRSDGYLGS